MERVNVDSGRRRLTDVKDDNELTVRKLREPMENNDVMMLNVCVAKKKITYMLFSKKWKPGQGREHSGNVDRKQIGDIF